MDQPVYVIKSVESVWTYKYNGKIYDVLKKVVWILVILFIISSLFFHKNTFMELAFGIRLLLIIMSVIILGTAYATEKTPSPFEIRFYEDYMVVYREKYYYDRNLSRKEYDKFFYKDIERIQYKKNIERYNIYGLVEWEYWNYRKDGTLSERSNGHKTVKGMCSFYTSKLADVDYKKWFELYTSRKVTIME